MSVLCALQDILTQLTNGLGITNDCDSPLPVASCPDNPLEVTVVDGPADECVDCVVDGETLCAALTSGCSDDRRDDLLQTLVDSQPGDPAPLPTGPGTCSPEVLYTEDACAAGLLQTLVDDDRDTEILAALTQIGLDDRDIEILAALTQIEANTAPPAEQIQVLAACDDVDGDPANFVPVWVRYTLVAGQPLTTEYFADAGLTAPYVPVGPIVDCTTGIEVEAPGPIAGASTHLIEGCVLSDPGDPGSPKVSAFTIVNDLGVELFAPKPLTDLGFVECCD